MLIIDNNFYAWYADEKITMYRDECGAELKWTLPIADTKDIFKAMLTSLGDALAADMPFQEFAEHYGYTDETAMMDRFAQAREWRKKWMRIVSDPNELMDFIPLLEERMHENYQ